MSKRGEMIVEIGAEGGSVALYRKQTNQGWCFTMELDDCTPVFEDEGEKPIYRMSAPVVDWDAALKLLDRYQWHKLYPVFVHPDFKRQIWDAVQERLPKKLSEIEQSSQQKLATNLWSKSDIFSRQIGDIGAAHVILQKRASKAIRRIPFHSLPRTR